MGIEVPPLRPLPNVALRKIVVQRDLRPLQHQQKVVPLPVNPPQRLFQAQRLFQVRKAGPALEEPVEVSLQGRLSLFRCPRPCRIQSAKRSSEFCAIDPKVCNCGL